jgi:hypothetical protein
MTMLVLMRQVAGTMLKMLDISKDHLTGPIDQFWHSEIEDEMQQ